MSGPADRPRNRLADETSPYLLQHAHNPVDWYPWGPEALERARREDKPILLSVGYSACHWCHVMERESFEDEATAELMNDRFVNVKVDREERPDLDELYMGAVQAFSRGHGGWPMTVFLTPTGAPFFGGTYFPPEPRSGMPSFRQVLLHASRMWRDARGQVQQTTAQLVAHLQETSALPPESGLTGDWLAAVARAAEDDFDPRDKGFGSAPKFPPHGRLAALLAHVSVSGDRRSLQMATATLDAMMQGGMYDVAGGGFCRYSVDGEWRVPHFEKMLYDNAQLVGVYLEAWRLTGHDRYARVVRETCDFVLRELIQPEGGISSALDADSDNPQGEPEEGWFYTWTPRELRDALGLLDGMRAATLLEVTDAGTFEHGRSVLRLSTPLENHDEADAALLRRALPRLRTLREERARPGRDDKVLVAWSALMAGALAQAGASLGEERYLDAAEAAVDFILREMVVEGRLQRTWRAGRAQVPAFTDDHAALINALVDLFEATGEAWYLDEALGLAGELVRLFWDTADGGFFYAGHDAEPLVTRSKKLMGGAEPSANGQAALALARLAALTGRADLGDFADGVLRRYQAVLDQAPRAIGVEALAAGWRTRRVRELAVVVGDDGGDALLGAAWRSPRAFTVLAPVADGEVEARAARLPWLAGKRAAGGQSTAFLCEGQTCLEPVQTPDALAAQLSAAREAGRRPVGFGRDRAPALPEDAASWLQADAPLSLERLRGQVVVLDFWTSCCINCLHVLPELAAVEERFAGRPVAVVGVHSAKFPMEKEPEAVLRAMQRHHVRHPVVLDPDHALWEQYAVKGWPTVMVLDATGRIAWRRSGEVDRDQLADVVEGLLQEAAEAGILADAPAVIPDEAAPVSTPLRAPGKVAVFPPTGAQEQGADPFDGSGRLYIADTGHHQILEARLELDADGWPAATLLRRFGTGAAGFEDGASDAAAFRDPQGLDRTGSRLFVADTGNHALREIDLDTGAVRTLAGTGARGVGAEPGAPLETALRSPWDVAAGGPEAGAARPGEEVLFIAMAGAHQLWVYVPAQDRLSAFAGTGAEAHVDGRPAEAALAQPSGLELFGRYLIFADSETSSVRFLDLQQRQVGTLVGQGLFDFGDTDGRGAEVRLQHPLDVAVAGGAVWVADTYNHKVKRIGLRDMETTTVAGADPGTFCEPGGVARAGGYLLVADTGAHRIRALRMRDGAVRDLPLR